MTAVPREFTIAAGHTYNQRSPLDWIAAHLWRYPLLSLSLVFANIVSAALWSLGFLLIGQAFDLISAPAAERQQLLWLALAVLAVRGIVALIELVKVSGAEILALRLERDARDELYISLLSKSQTFHNRQRVGDVMARATNDVQQLNLMISPGASLILEAIIFTVVPLVAVATLNLNLLLTPLVFLLVFALALRDYSRQLAPVTGALRGQFGTINAGLAEAIAGIEVVKGYTQESSEQAKFNQNARRYRDLFVQEGKVQARYLPLLLFGLLLGAGFGHALLLFRAGTLSIGDVVGFMGLLGILRFPTFISLFTFSLVQLGVASAARILELLRATTELDENRSGYSAPINGAIDFQAVSFAYAAGNQSSVDPAANGAPADVRSAVLRDVTFQAQPGETIAVVGQTGAGKTTLTRLVNRIFDATAGRILIDGVDVRDWSLEALRSQISTIEQDVFLFSRTIAENIAFGAREPVSRDQIMQAAREAQAHEFISALPAGYDTLVGERGVTLSGGQRQRIAIARALLTNPRILILDDSTSAIDSATEDQIQRAIRRVLHGRTTLLITHRISQIRWANRILVLRSGELVAQGTHDELLQSSPAYRRIFARYAAGE